MLFIKWWVLEWWEGGVDGIGLDWGGVGTPNICVVILLENGDENRFVDGEAEDGCFKVLSKKSFQVWIALE